MSTQRNYRAVLPPLWVRACLAVFAAAALVVSTFATTAGRADTQVTSQPVTATWEAAADTYVIAERPSASPGDGAKLTAARWSDWHTTSYVRFRVDELRTDLPVASVTVAFTLRGAEHQPALTDLRTVPSNSWSEADTSYRNRPRTGDVVASAGDPAGAATVSFDVTDQVRGAGTYSFAVANRTADSAFVAHSRESGTKGPRLIVTYGSRPQPSASRSQPGPSSPAPSSPAPSSPAPSSPAPSDSPTSSPTPTEPTDMRCGAAFKPEASGETYQEALAREDNLLGGLDTVRVYYTGAPKPWPGKLDTDGRPIIVSFKLKPTDVLAGRYDDHLRQWFADAPTGQDTYWVYYHEPEDNIARGEFSAADYRDAWRHIAGLADRAGNSKLHATLTLMGYSVEPASKRNWRDYYPGRDTIDVLAWDIYNYVNEGKGGYRDPATLFGRAVEVSRSEKLPFAVAETGSAIARGDDGSGRADWIRDTFRYLDAAGAVFVSYFDMYIEANHGPQHYELRDRKSQAAFREVCG